MDKRYRNLGVLVIIIVFAVAIYFLAVQEPAPVQVQNKSFEQGLGELNSIFSSNDIELFSPGFVADLTSLDTAGLLALNADLLIFKNNLSGYDSESKATLDDMADICIGFVDLAKINQEFDSKLEAVSAVNVKDYCAYTVLFESRDSIGRERMDLLESLDSSIASFDSKYPLESQVSGLDKITVVNIGVELAKNQFEMEGATIELKESCGGI